MSHATFPEVTGGHPDTEMCGGQGLDDCHTRYGPRSGSICFTLWNPVSQALPWTPACCLCFSTPLCVSDAHSNLRTTTFKNLLHPGLSHIVFHRKQASWTPGVVPGVQETWGELHTSIPLEGVECMLVSGEAVCLSRRVPNTLGLGRCFSKGN